MVKKKFATHVFVLDTLCDTSDAREGAEMAEPQPDCSVRAQLAAMKLICCAGMPEKVAVVLMGGTPAEVRLGLSATEAWRVRAGRGSEPDSESILRGYEALPSPPEPELQQEAMQESTTRAERSDTGDASNEEEADRIVAALKASVEAVTSRHWTELDLFEQEEKARITVFLGSPPKDLSKSRDVLIGLKDKMAAVGVSLHFILDPRAYDKKRQVFIECFFSPCCGWTEERPSVAAKRTSTFLVKSWATTSAATSLPRASLRPAAPTTASTCPAARSRPTSWSSGRSVMVTRERTFLLYSGSTAGFPLATTRTKRMNECC